jgi:hypothetical protein
MDIHPEFRIREAADADLCGNLFRQPRNEKADDLDGAKDNPFGFDVQGTEKECHGFTSPATRVEARRTFGFDLPKSPAAHSERRLSGSPANRRVSRLTPVASTVPIASTIRWRRSFRGASSGSRNCGYFSNRIPKQSRKGMCSITTISSSIGFICLQNASHRSLEAIAESAGLTLPPILVSCPLAQIQRDRLRCLK